MNNHSETHLHINARYEHIRAHTHTPGRYGQKWHILIKYINKCALARQLSHKNMRRFSYQNNSIAYTREFLFRFSSHWTTVCCCVFCFFSILFRFLLFCLPVRFISATKTTATTTSQQQQELKLQKAQSHGSQNEPRVKRMTWHMEKCE